MSGRIDWTKGFIAVDWGTTNRRAYLVLDRGEASDEFEDGKGIMSVERGEFEAAVAEIRARLGDLPMLLAGMVGSNRGWIEVPYVPCPAGLRELSAGLHWCDQATAIVPGVSFLDDARADVMRGEEVQLLGAVAAGDIPQDCLVCHPGTHNKWTRMDEGRIAEFRTVMTGELFSLLAKHSILGDFLGDEAMYDAPFRAGVREGLSGGALAADLFSVRASVLLGRLPKQHAVAFTSGLLIGQDVRVGLAQASELPTIAMGRPELTKLYRMALEEAGVEATEIDGEGAFIAGACRIVECMQ
jgi:2-dehydro-3-deoxygalactonokinase